MSWTTLCIQEATRWLLSAPDLAWRRPLPGCRDIEAETQIAADTNQYQHYQPGNNVAEIQAGTNLGTFLTLNHQIKDYNQTHFSHVH